MFKTIAALRALANLLRLCPTTIGYIWEFILLWSRKKLLLNWFVWPGMRVFLVWYSDYMIV